MTGWIRQATELNRDSATGRDLGQRIPPARHRREQWIPQGNLHQASRISGARRVRQTRSRSGCIAVQVASDTRRTSRNRSG